MDVNKMLNNKFVEELIEELEKGVTERIKDINENCEAMIEAGFDLDELSDFVRYTTSKILEIVDMKGRIVELIEYDGLDGIIGDK